MKDFKEFLFEYDTAFNVEDGYKISDNKEVGEYLYGRCHVFAMVLHEYLGLPIEIIIDEEPWHDTMGLPSLEHAYCIINDDYVVDARGIRTRKEIMDEYGSNANELVVVPDCLELLKEWVNNGALISPEHKEIEDIKLYIETLKAHNVFAIAPDNYDDISLENHLVSILPDKPKKMKIK
jgi:hypothetical protein